LTGGAGEIITPIDFATSAAARGLAAVQVAVGRVRAEWAARRGVLRSA
jgi:hypothetical protein